MAAGGEAEKAQGDATIAGAGAASLQGTSTPPREKPVIEGKVVKSESSGDEKTAGATSEAAAGAAVMTEATLLGPAVWAETSSTEGDAAASAQETAAASDAPSERPRWRANPWPFVAVALGAAVAVGGAFALHRLETTPKAIAALQARVAALEHRPLPSAVSPAEITDLDTRVDALEKDRQTAGAALAQLRQTVQHLEEAHKQGAATPATDAKALPQSGPAPVDLAPLSARIGKLEQSFAALDGEMHDLAATYAATYRAARSAQAAGEHATQAAMAHAEANAVAILAADLRRKVEAGAAFAQDLSALGNYGFDKDKAATLQSVAASGLATPGALAKQFSALEPQILATKATSRPKSFFGRLAADAAHLIRIRRIGETAGHDLAAQVARIDAALARGDVEAALREWNDLPAAAKVKSQAFAAAAQQRIAALAAVKAIEDDALAALAKAKS